MNLGLLLLIIIYVILTAIFIFGIVRNIKNNNIDSTLENGFTNLWIWLHFVIMVGGTIIAFTFLIKYLWTIPLW